MAANGVIANGYHNNADNDGPMTTTIDINKKTEDIYDGITTHLENILCPHCFEFKRLRNLHCSENHSFCDDCLDIAMILRKCPSCSTDFVIPPGGVSGMASDVTHEQIKDTLDSLCRLRSTNCPVCALDENDAKLASKVYKYCRNEKELVCQKCAAQCERDLDLMDYNKVPESSVNGPSAPEVSKDNTHAVGRDSSTTEKMVTTNTAVPTTVTVTTVTTVAEGPVKPAEDMDRPNKVKENGHSDPENTDKEPEVKEVKEVNEKDTPEPSSPVNKVSEKEGHVNGYHTPAVEINEDSETTSSESSGEDDVDARPITTPHISPSDSLASPCLSASSSHEPITTPPPAYEPSESYEAPALPPKAPLGADGGEDPVVHEDLPILHENWSHQGTPLSRGNDVIFLPNDDSIIVADYYAGQVHKFSTHGELIVSKLLKHSPWSFAKERSKGPWSVAYSYSNDMIYASEIGMSSICRMSPKDLKVDKKRLKLEGVENPAGLAFLRNNQLVLTEDMYRGPHRVAIYDLNGKLVKEWASTDPQLLCVDQHDRIVVSDHKSDCVEVYDTTGRLLTSFGNSKTLRRPMGVATDDNCNIYVTHETPKGYALSLWSDGRRVGILHEWDHNKMTLTERDHWHMRSVDVHNNNLVLLGRRTLHGYRIKY